MDWDGLRLLLEVARTGSLLRAGRALGVATSTVSRRLTALEEGFGVRLVERASDGCRLTVQGELVAQSARAMSRELGRVREQMAGAVSGKVVVACSDGFVSAVTDFVARFEVVHPECVVEIDVNNDYVRVAKGEADVAIRMAHLGEPSLVYRRLMTMDYGYFCASALRERLVEQGGGVLPRPGQVPFVSVSPPLDRAPQARAATAAGFVKVKVRTNSFMAQLSAVQRGIGVATMPVLASEGLVRVFEGLEVPGADVFLAMRHSSTRQPHIRAFVDALMGDFMPQLLGAG